MEPTELQRAAPGGAPTNGAACLLRSQGCSEEHTCGAAPLPCRITGQDEAVWRRVASDAERRAGAA